VAWYVATAVQEIRGVAFCRHYFNNTEKSMKPGFDNPQNKTIPGPRDWLSCGAQSVYHALLCLGIVADKESVVSFASLNPFKPGGPGLLLEDLMQLAKELRVSAHGCPVATNTNSIG
jgi:hypothetical protein